MFKKVFSVIKSIFSFFGRIVDKAVDDGIVDLSGQGRDKYGK